ncbi:MAG: HAMP domain-containing protein [Deltaproteobacteria bacterium]|jgi:signal transduction histidine kinase|nr:HAMP domain-containing protein [Deltaproteobacteria bacterium]MBT6503353.1 HAMP domain-containing protein [Deltaproteobacteria bacterium]
MFINKYLSSFRGKLTALVTTAILLPMILSSTLLGGLLEKQLRASFESRLEAGLETFQLILNNKRNVLIQGLTRMASDNTLQMTLKLEIIPQLRKYIESQIEVLGLSTLVVSDVEKQIVASSGETKGTFSAWEGSELVTNATDTFISYTLPIYRDGDLLGYVHGAISLKGHNFLKYLQEKLVDNYALWSEEKLITTNITSNIRPAFWKMEVAKSADGILIVKDDYKIMANAIDFSGRRLSYGVLFPFKEQHREFHTIVWVIGTIVLVIFMVILLLTRFFVGQLIAPVTQLTQASLNIEKGQDIPNLDDQRSDEFGQMAVAFKSMVKNLKSSEKELKIHRDNLKDMVTARTAELKATFDDLQNTQSQLLQSEKMASIGQLAAGVAHEINNPVGFVKSNLSTLNEYIKDIMELLVQYQVLEKEINNEKETDENRIVKNILEKIVNIKEDIDLDFIIDDFKNVIEESLDGTERVENIVCDLKNFAHLDKAELQEFDINQGIESTLNIVRNEIKYKAEVIKDLGDIPRVKCYPQRINQVLMNLLVNAAHAIEDRGEIRIATRINGEDVEIKISDTGCGIPAENLSRIFDPFFTTKEVGKGTGLGLNMVYHIIEKHKGKIDVQSEVGKGTRFTIHLKINPDIKLNEKQTGDQLQGQE